MSFLPPPRAPAGGSVTIGQIVAACRACAFSRGLTYAEPCMNATAAGGMGSDWVDMAGLVHDHPVTELTEQLADKLFRPEAGVGPQAG